MRILGFITAVVLALPPTAQGQARPVWLELVLAMDVSTSVDPREYALQQNGLALAFADPAVMLAIRSSGGVAITAVQWAGKGNVRQVLDWRVLETEADSLAFAGEIAGLARDTKGFTDIDGAIRYSMSLFDQNDVQGVRQVIDVSGDGTATETNPSAARDLAISRGIIVNGLVILNEDMDLGILADEDTIGHYRDFVIGGPGAFLIVADGFEDFARAIREKLLREISGPMLSQLR